jgi:hypothetical protein
MEYRIKTIEYKNGIIRYRAQVKKWYGWMDIFYKQELDPFLSGETVFGQVLYFSEENAKSAIDCHFKLQRKVFLESIETIKK